MNTAKLRTVAGLSATGGSFLFLLATGIEALANASLEAKLVLAGIFAGLGVGSVYTAARGD